MAQILSQHMSFVILKTKVWYFVLPFQGQVHNLFLFNFTCRVLNNPFFLHTAFFLKKNYNIKTEGLGLFSFITFANCHCKFCHLS